MEFRRKVPVGASLSLAMFLFALAATGCGGILSGTTTTSIAQSTTSSSPTTSTAGSTTSTAGSTTSTAGSTTSSSVAASSAEREAAETYFAAMAPVIHKDYQSLQWFDQVMSEWQQTYGDTSLSTNRQAWDALGSIVQQAIPKEQEIIQGYEAIAPAEAFRAAHAALLQNNRNGNAWAEDFLAAIKANRPTSELMSMLSAGPPGPSNSDVLADFQGAAARVGIDLPIEFTEAYSDGADSGGVSA